MDKNELEDVMLRFMNKEFNVLICTTIIETGIDIPNANTMIVEDADKFGLAQLYQIRGRVGRSERGAYAYLLYKKDKSIQDDALKRLKAIKELLNLVVVIKLPCVIYQFVVPGTFLVLLKVVSSTQSDSKCTRNSWKRLSNKRQGKTQVRRKGNADSIFRLMLTSLLTIFLTSAKKLKFISVFEKLRIRKTIKTFKMSLLTALENIQTKLPISLRLVWLRPIWMLPLQN